MGAIIATNLILAESWSGYAIFMPEGQRRLLLTPAVGSNSRTNFSEGAGTLRLWFAPNWASTSAGGSGPGDWAILFDLFQTNAVTNLFGTLTTITNPFRLVLAADAAGTNLVVGVDTLTNSRVLLRHPISFSTGVWHQIAFAYWSNGVSLVVDDNPESISTNVPPWPGNSVWNQSAFSLGGGFTGHHLSQGQLDEIYTFKFPLSTNYLTWTYQSFAPVAALGPIPDGGGGIATMDAPSPCDPCPSPTNDPPYTNIYIGGWTTNAGLKFAAVPYITNGTSYGTVLDEASPFRSYQIFRTLAFAPVTTNTVWSLAANGAVGVRNFTLAMPTNSAAFWLAAEAKDTDYDGLSDAYEQLINQGTNATGPHTDWQKFDTDGTGIGDERFTIEWDMRTLNTNYADGVLLEGNGFQITGYQPLKYIVVYFDQRYRGYPLKDFPRDTPEPTRAVQTNLDTTLMHYKVVYDLKSLRVYRNGVSLKIEGVDDGIEWLDNMTDSIGTNGPVNLNVPASNMLITNVVVTQFPPVYQRSRYTYMGSIGNTCSNFFGPAMHGAYQRIKKMVIHENTNAFYTTTYNEGGTSLQKFNPLDPQVVISNFGPGVASILITNLTISNNVLYAKFTSNYVERYNVTNCALIGSGTAFPVPAPPTVSNPSIGRRLDWSKSPADGTIAVYDANIDVVRVYNANSNGLVYSIGMTNGYSNGPSILIPSTNSNFRSQVRLGAVWYDKQNRATNATVCFQADGKLWVSDTATGRLLRFMTNGGCDAWIMFFGHTYCAYADPNAPQRVFNEYLEFRVDYNTLSDTGGWVLTNYWGYNVTPRPDTTDQGLFNVTTVTIVSNRTYALVWDPAANGCLQSRRIVELTATGLRPTSISNLICNYRLQPDGALHRTDVPNVQNPVTVGMTRQVITNFAANGDPQYSAATNAANVIYTNQVNPLVFDFKIAGDKLIVYQDSDLFTNNHLGAVSYASNAVWLWQTMPTGPLNGRGNFDLDSPGGAGAEFITVDDNIFALYRGEFWKGNRQANQIYHYKTDGTFVGQFGMPLWNDVMFHAIGSGNNMAALSYAKTNGFIYLFTNDESGRGVQVWRVEP